LEINPDHKIIQQLRERVSAFARILL
jgi:hypothetical protein